MAKLKLTDSARRNTAVHEAGHAVIGRVLGLSCGGISIVPSYRRMTAGFSVCDIERSRADWDFRGRFRWRSLLRARIMMLQAGREAEVVLLGRCSGGDGDDLREIAVTMGEAEVDWAKVDRLQGFTSRLVERHRRAIEAVAAALLEHERLSIPHLDALVWGSGSRFVRRVANPAKVNLITRNKRITKWETVPISWPELFGEWSPPRRQARRQVTWE
jgi:ATP-dependent Zn protease